MKTVLNFKMKHRGHVVCKSVVLPAAGISQP